MRDNISRLPVALRLESTNALKLAAFMAGVRTMVDQSAPGLTSWAPVEHAGLAYVKVTANTRDGDMTDIAICYAALPDSLVVSLSEDVIRRSVERSAARRAATRPATQAAASAPATRPWLGSNAALQVDARMAETLVRLGEPALGDALQRASWSNLPILNEWKRLAPQADPVALHEKWWGERLVCPAGGKYVWNERLQTMESTAAGCPEAPKLPAATPLELKGLTFGSFGLTLENQGLRARMMLQMAEGK